MTGGNIGVRVSLAVLMLRFDLDPDESLSHGSCVICGGGIPILIVSSPDNDIKVLTSTFCRAGTRRTWQVQESVWVKLKILILILAISAVRPTDSWPEQNCRVLSKICSETTSLTQSLSMEDHCFKVICIALK
ncbi:hypothetical protein BCON_0019g00520 [Botryotinia convoluta]|uniref:Uncharacterized protein n=1 Tax=Botryotinia convoluta TaxID=54673 RepID=A0A4Z1IM83_9HELO|nr:hypothetical protein BCON_0019g00520 [Botryotinia convoluta]